LFPINKEIIVAIDALGGDNAPSEIVKGAVAALEFKGLRLVLLGDEKLISAELGKYSFDAARISVVDAPENIGNDEVPTTAIRTKKNSSVVKGLTMLKKGEVGAFVSAGSTGAVLAGATLIVGRIKGVSRPALAAVLPNVSGRTVLIDTGANVDANPEYLAQFAKLGAAYAKFALGVTNPRVGLINIGAEKEKGNAQAKEAYPLLEQSGLNFIGNVEARDIPLGAVDVAVCDAFTGNVILKYSEGFAKGLMQMIKQELTSTLITKIGALIAGGGFKRLKKRFDYREIGGAPFLGLTGLVVKAHGSSDSIAFKNAIRQCYEFIENDIVKKTEELL
jgi:glycerol-3-phosphate acyltransferase PlsX